MAEMGEVPRSALVIRLTPRELMNSPTRNTRYRFAFSNICIYSFFNHTSRLVGKKSAKKQAGKNAAGRESA